MVFLFLICYPHSNRKKKMHLGMNQRFFMLYSSKSQLNVKEFNHLLTWARISEDIWRRTWALQHLLLGEGPQFGSTP